MNYDEESESDGQSDEDDDGRDKQLLYGIRMRAADPRYLTTDDDVNRGDILLTMEQVKELITVKLRSEEEVATVWLTTSEDGILSDGRTKHSYMYQGCEGRESL